MPIGKSSQGTKSIARRTAGPVLPSSSGAGTAAVSIGKTNTKIMDKRRVIPHPDASHQSTMRFKVRQMPGTHATQNAGNISLSTRKWQSHFQSQVAKLKTVPPAVGTRDVNHVRQRHGKILPQLPPRFPDQPTRTERARNSPMMPSSLAVVPPFISAGGNTFEERQASRIRSHVKRVEESYQQLQQPRGYSSQQQPQHLAAEHEAASFEYKSILCRTYTRVDIDPLCVPCTPLIFHAALKKFLSFLGRSDNIILNRVASMCKSTSGPENTVLPFAHVSPAELGLPEMASIDGFTMIHCLFENISKHASDRHLFFYSSIRNIVSQGPTTLDVWAKLLDLTLVTRI